MAAKTIIKREETRTLEGTTYTFHLEHDEEQLRITDVRVGSASIIAMFDAEQLQLAYNDFYSQLINREA